MDGAVFRAKACIFHIGYCDNVLCLVDYFDSDLTAASLSFIGVRSEMNLV